MTSNVPNYFNTHIREFSRDIKSFVTDYFIVPFKKIPFKQHIEKFAIDSLIFYSNSLTFINNTFEEFYQSYPKARLFRNLIYHTLNQCHGYLTNRKVEPFLNNWTGVFWVNPDKQYFQEYLITDYPYKTISEIRNEIVDFCKNAYFFKNVDKTLDDSLIISKTDLLGDPKYLVVRMNANNMNLEPVPSPTRFISIVYTQPLLKNNIFLELDTGFYMTGNVLFSPTFVLRMLKHQLEPFEYHMDYRIILFDSDMTEIILTHNEYILLNARGYSVEIINEKLVLAEYEDTSYEELSYVLEGTEYKE